MSEPKHSVRRASGFVQVGNTETENPDHKMSGTVKGSAYYDKVPKSPLAIAKLRYG